MRPAPGSSPAPGGSEDLPGELYLFGYPRTSARVAVVRHTSAARAWRALRVLALCWGLGVLAILVPIAHFVLVPGFVLLGIALAVGRLREGATIVGVSGTCPRCGVERALEAGGRLRAETRAACPECLNSLALTLELSAEKLPEPHA